MAGLLNVSPAAVNLSSATELAISGEMEAGTAAGSTALTGTVPMVPTIDDVGLSTALNAAGAGYLGVVQEHLAQRTAYAGAQSLSSLSYVLDEVLNAANISAVI